MAGARDYKPNDLKRLFALSGCECANPSCNNKLIAKDYNSILGEICHIEAASSDGPRFNPKQTNEERRSFDNLILLCESCHKIIDNKANEKEINLWQDQLIHITQIIGTFLVFFMEV